MAKNKNWKKPSAASSPQPAKLPAFAKAPVEGKTPAAILLPWRDERPSWRIAQLDVIDDQYGWHKVSPAKMLYIREKLASYESMTWNEILADQDYNHHIDVNRVKDKGVRKRLDEMGLETVLRLRLTGAERIWGYRVGAVLHIIWWDPLHNICPSIRKHT